MAVTYTPPTQQIALSGSPSTINLGSFTATDSGPWTVSVDWNDLSSITTFQVTSTGAIPAQNHVYASTGTFGPKVTVTSTISPFSSDGTWFYCSSLPTGVVTPTNQPSFVAYAGDFSEPARINPVLNYLYEVPFGKLYTQANTRWTTSYSWGDGRTNFFFAGVTEAWVIPRTNTGWDVQCLHVYAAPGTYNATVTLTNVDNPSLVGSMSRNVIVS